MPKVLIIEDEINIRAFISTDLESRGYSVLEAGTGEEGLELLRETAPDVLILDMLLPDTTGWHILDAMNKDEALKTIPVILLTASVNIGRSIHYPNLVQHMMKPASIKSLLEAVQRALNV